MSKVEPAAALMQDVAEGDIAVWDIPTESRRRVPTPMQGHGRILTTDERDFRTYRWKSRKPFQNLLA